MIADKIKKLHQYNRAVLLDLLIDHLLLLEESKLDAAGLDIKTIDSQKHEQILELAEETCSKIDQNVLQKIFSELISSISESIGQEIIYQ
jgi:hypothetical protein